ncbi:hypothetical protein [Hyalangium versicolor]|uniref:hypothetical protein n=1 Tax=Hyalangium versicolor TaxID=2861190 RepID=UPI001CC91967|nr:hypothetical protein [Hyalangium versicolor]
MLRTSLHLRRASSYFAHAAEELDAARAELEVASEAFTLVELRARAVRLAAQCTERFRDARGQVEAFAQYAKRAEDLGASTRDTPPAQLDGGVMGSQAAPALGGVREGAAAAREGGRLW